MPLWLLQKNPHITYKNKHCWDCEVSECGLYGPGEEAIDKWADCGSVHIPREPVLTVCGGELRWASSVSWFALYAKWKGSMLEDGSLLQGLQTMYSHHLNWEIMSL